MNKCIQCGKETNYKQLNNGVWACKECLDKIGKEQKDIVEEIENILVGSGIEDYKSLCNTIYNFEQIINFIYKSTSVESIPQLINSIAAARKYIEFTNDLMSPEELKEFEVELKKWVDNCDEI